MLLSTTPAATHRRPLKKSAFGLMRFKKVGFGFLRHAFQDCFRSIFVGGFLALQRLLFGGFWLFKGGLGRSFWHSCGAWGRTWALGKGFWEILALFCDLWGVILGSLGTLVADIGCLWASFGPSLADFGELWGPFWTLCGGILEICGHFLFTSAEPRQTKEFLGNP